MGRKRSLWKKHGHKKHHDGDQKRLVEAFNAEASLKRSGAENYQTFLAKKEKPSSGLDLKA